jgi:UDP-N-acetylmuramoyl-tripeptide--D-alanyl-D-alanine ligase
MKHLLKHIVVSILTWEAKAVIRKYKPVIVAVTGSVGKTSTKDAIFTALAPFVHARKSEKSFNSELGVPLTVLGCPNGWNDPAIWARNILEGLLLILLPNPYPKTLILEVGADRPGDIAAITTWVKPHITVVTRLSKVPVHVEYFANAQALFREKAYLVEALDKDGTLILNADDEDVLAFRGLVENPVLLYGIADNADVHGESFATIRGEGNIPEGISFTAIIGTEPHAVEIRGGLGVQQMYPALAALAVAKALGYDVARAAAAMKEHEPPRGRMRLIPGVKGSVIIDDTYNASPVATEEALNVLAEEKRPRHRRIAILGDMLELGIHSVDEHKKAGELAAASADILCTVGLRARGIAEGALNAGMDEAKIFQFEDSREAGKHIEVMLKKGDTVLVKGSQGMRMERAVAEMMAEPQKKSVLLVRQDTEWQNR